MEEESTRLCEICQQPIERAAIIQDGPLSFIKAIHKTLICLPCRWKDFERTSACLSRPFKLPIPRSGKTGTPPAEFYRAIKNRQITLSDLKAKGLFS